MSNPFSYFELHTPDLAASRAFYGKLFDWKIEEVSIPGHKYAEVNAGAGPAGGIRGDLEQLKKPLWMAYFAVADIDEGVNKAQSLGAKVVVPRTDIPEGSYAVFSDPQGATFALFTRAAA